MPTTFEPGTSLSHYRVIAPLGAGGMGEVYKAQDLTLERPIALKILPPELVRNDERVRRFVQEAKSASSLNHPNIITIHEIGQAEASSSDGTAPAETRPVHYIAMELVDGTTLRHKIHDEQTDLRTLLVYLAQVADGLAKAHGAGIIHRDLKPENIMVTRDGFAKVLDFGLAKLTIKQGTDLTSEPTAVRNDTREGVRLGTVGYMSPEQVQARPVDHRSDVFSFGSILYEAATRRRPFEADSDIDVMHKIVHEKPAPIDEIAPGIPAELRKLIRRCLAKDPDKRFQSMRDVSLDLTEIVDEFEELSASASSRTGSASVSAEIIPPAARRNLQVAIGAAILVALAAVAFAVHQWREARARPAGSAVFASMKLTRLTSSGNVIRSAISPDGRYLAQVLRDADAWSVSVRQVATASDVQIVPPSKLPISAVAFSPDGHYLLYVHREHESGAGYASLFQVPVLGGPPRKLIFDVDTAPTFSPDGKRMAFGRGYVGEGLTSVVLANSDGSGERILVKQQRLFRTFAPSWSPDGKSIMVPIDSVEGGRHSRLVALDPDSGAELPISGRWLWIDDAAWLPDGSGIVVIGGMSDQDRQQVWLQPYPGGEPRRITNDLNDYSGLSLTADAQILTRRLEQRNELTISEPSDETGGPPLSPGTADQAPWHVSAAASGAVAYAFQGESGMYVAVIDAAGEAPRVLTTEGKSANPSISEDGKTIAFISWRNGDIAHVFVMDGDGSNVRQLTRGEGQGSVSLTPDGSTAVYHSIDRSIWSIPVSGGQPRKIVENVSSYAADSTRIAYTYWAAGQEPITGRLAVVPISGGPPSFEIPFVPGTPIRWARDGKTLTFMRPRGGAAQILRVPLDGSPPEELTRFASGRITSYDFTADGRLVMARGEQRSDAVLISAFR